MFLSGSWTRFQNPPGTITGRGGLRGVSGVPSGYPCIGCESSGNAVPGVRPGLQRWTGGGTPRRFDGLHRRSVSAGSAQGRSTGALTSAPSWFPVHVRDPGRNAPAAIQAPSPGDRSRKVLRSRWRTRRVRRSATHNARRRTTVPKWFPDASSEHAPRGFLDQRFPGAPGDRAGPFELPAGNDPGAIPSHRGRTPLLPLQIRSNLGPERCPADMSAHVPLSCSLRPAAPPR